MLFRKKLLKFVICFPALNQFTITFHIKVIKRFTERINWCIRFQFSIQTLVIRFQCAICEKRCLRFVTNMPYIFSVNQTLLKHKRNCWACDFISIKSFILFLKTPIQYKVNTIKHIVFLSFLLWLFFLIIFRKYFNHTLRKNKKGSLVY